MHSKGNYQRGEKTALRMGENNSKWKSDKGLISKIYKRLIQFNTRKANNPIKKWEKDLGRHFSKEDIQTANKHSVHCERNANQNYNEVSPHTSQNGHHPKSTNNKCWRGCGEKGTLLHCWWQCNPIQPLWKMVWRFFFFFLVWRFFKKLGIKAPYDPAIPNLGIYPEETKIERDTWIPLFIAALYNS